MMKNLWISFCFLLTLAVAGCSDEDETPKNVTLTNGTQTTQVVYADQTQTGGGGISFTALADWTATVTEVALSKAGGSTVDWLTLSAYSGGPGEYTLTLTLKENNTGQDRMAKIEIVCGSDVITITVEQKGTTEGGETPAPRGKRLARMEYANVDSNYPDSYGKYILTFAYDAQGRLSEMHDISYVGDEQAYYSDDVYTFTYEGQQVRLEQAKNDYEPYVYVMQMNEAGDVALLYEEDSYGSSTVTAWRFDYDNDRYLQRIVEDNLYEPDGDGDEDDDVDVGVVPEPSTRAFTSERLSLSWQDGNLRSTTNEWAQDYYMTWDYTSHPNETPGLDFNVMSARPLFGNQSGDYTDIVNMLFALRMLGQNSRNLVKNDYVNWAYHSSVNPDAPEPTTQTTHEDYWLPFEYTFTAENYLSRVTARAVLRTTVTDIASGQVISESESYYDDEYLFTYE